MSGSPGAPSGADGAAGPSWLVRDGAISFARPVVMGILNVTPDSFSDGGLAFAPEAARDRALEMAQDGAAIIDIGGESTRPGAAPVDAPEQWARVGPVLRLLGQERSGLAGVRLSVDTTRAAVAQAAVDHGAAIINDVSAGRDDPELLAVTARSGAGLVLMHRLVRPAEDRYSDQYRSAPAYEDVVASVAVFLRERLEAAEAAGVERARVVLDPGLGFGKSVQQNLELIHRTGELVRLGRPIVSALSRKSFVGRASGLAESLPMERAAGTLALTVAHRLAGAGVFRVHDVKAAVEALRAVEAMISAGGTEYPRA